MTHGDDLRPRINLRQPIGELAERHQSGIRKPGYLPFHGSRTSSTCTDAPRRFEQVRQLLNEI